VEQRSDLTDWVIDTITTVVRRRRLTISEEMAEYLFTELYSFGAFLIIAAFTYRRERVRECIRQARELEEGSEEVIARVAREWRHFLEWAYNL